MSDDGSPNILFLAAIILIYWLVPTDIIPDGLPLGFLDDVIVTLLAGTGIMKSQI